MFCCSFSSLPFSSSPAPLYFAGNTERQPRISRDALATALISQPEGDGLGATLPRLPRDRAGRGGGGDFGLTLRCLSRVKAHLLSRPHATEHVCPPPPFRESERSGVRISREEERVTPVSLPRIAERSAPEEKRQNSAGTSTPLRLHRLNCFDFKMTFSCRSRIFRMNHYASMSAELVIPFAAGGEVRARVCLPRLLAVP